MKDGVARSHIKTHISLKVQLSRSSPVKRGKRKELPVSIAFMCFYMIVMHQLTERETRGQLT